MDQPPRQPTQSFVKYLPFLVLAIALTWMYLSFYVFEARVRIDLQTDAPPNTYLKIYWAGEGQAFSEGRMAQAQIKPQQAPLHLYIADLANITRIRIDPIESTGEILLREISIQQFGYQPIVLRDKSAFAALTLIQQIERSTTNPDGFAFQATGDDSQLALKLSPTRQTVFPAQQLLTVFAMLILLALVRRYGNPLLTDLRFVPVMLVIGLGLAVLMAINTGLNVHPDEIVHLSAVNFYAQHLLPPPLDAELAAPTYSIYGRTRLSNFEIYYQLAGAFRKLPDFLGAPALFGTRLFSLLLFAALTLFSGLNKPFRPFALPMMLSAQIWYLFSYANSDAFALVLAIFISYLAAYPKSMLNRFITEAAPKYYLLKLAVLGSLLGALLLSKPNYYFFILFLGLYFLWRVMQGHFPDQKRLWSRVALLAVVASLVFGARWAMDISANGWDRSAIITQMQEKYASPAYKNSTGLKQKNPMLNLRQQGQSLGQVVITDRWFPKTFISSFGVYGFTEFFSNLRFYDFVRYTGILLLFMLFIGTVRQQALPHLALLFIITLCASGLIFSVIWHSWNTSFQAQGRYMLPIFPMLGILYYHARAYALPTIVEWLSIALFGFAVYSFVFTGLHEMAGLWQF